MDVLREKISAHRAAILDLLDLNKDMLALLSKHNVIDIMECVKLQQTAHPPERNNLFLDMLTAQTEDRVYVSLIECLQKTGQEKVTSYLIDVRIEMQILSQMQSNVEGQLQQMAEFLATEERRAGIYLTEPPPEEDDGKPAVTEKEVWTKVQQSMKTSQQQLNRCQAVIRKLHEDCAAVAKQNSDIIEHTKECDAKLKELLNTGRNSAKQNTVPKKTQDLFENLMNDIEKLVRTRRKVIDKETEGRRHSTRIIRQCRDWVEGRNLCLEKMAANAGPVALKGREVPQESELSVALNKKGAKGHENGVMTVLDSLQLLENELLDYIHKEITVTDRFRSEMRQKSLAKRVHGFSIHGMGDIESALDNLEKDPEHLKDHVAIVRTCVGEINREYGECVSFLNRVEPTDPSPRESNGSPQATRRDTKANFRKRAAHLGGKLSRSIDNNMHGIGKERSEPNQLLERIQSLVIRHEELKSEDQVVGNKYRAEMSKKRRETDIVLQKKDDQLMKLQTEIKEALAEKEKYKKLYNDTKIGYQRNKEQVSSAK